ncbi:MAG TPA: hypothetical protein VFW28_10395 [Micropepsaceae bacterium]|nr:hypothetical protein [Micropepsaceae bacterium]
MITMSSAIKKAKKSKPPARRSPGSAKPPLAIEADERHREDVDNYISRNRDALNSSIRKSRREIAEGKVSSKSLDSIIAEGRQRHLRQS